MRIADGFGSVPVEATRKLGLARAVPRAGHISLSSRLQAAVVAVSGGPVLRPEQVKGRYHHISGAMPTPRRSRGCADAASAVRAFADFLPMLKGRTSRSERLRNSGLLAFVRVV